MASRFLIVAAACVAQVSTLDAEEKKTARFQSVGAARDACRNTPADVLKVVEPIRVVDCIYWEDGGSCGVEFVDARKRIFRMCLDQRLPPLHEVPHGTIVRCPPSHVFVGVMHPDEEDGRKVARLGPEELALYGLMLRWFEKHPHAHGIADRKGLDAAVIDNDAARVYHVLIRDLDYRFTNAAD